MSDILRALQHLIDQAIAAVRPPRAFSWQTSLWLSVFSWVMASLSQANWLEALLMNFAWLFLIAGVNWALLEHPLRILGVPLGPWITGALVCLYVFDRPDGLNWQAATVSWPLFAAAIAAVPVFLSRELRLQRPDIPGRQQLVILILVNVLLSCWIQFSFRVQYWLEQYPTLAAADFTGSAFVVAVGDESQETLARGVPLLTELEAVIKSQINNQPWSATERWLMSIQNPDTMADLEELTKERVVLQNEGHFWHLWIPQPTSGAADSTNYRIVLEAHWAGPHAGQERPLYLKSCQVRQTTSSAGVNFSTATSVTPQDLSATPLTAVECGKIEKRLVAPEPATAAVESNPAS